MELTYHVSKYLKLISQANKLLIEYVLFSSFNKQTYLHNDAGAQV